MSTTASPRSISARDLKTQLHDGGEIALLDARDEGSLERRHILMAACVPFDRLEVLIDDLVPRRGTRTVWCDDGDGLAFKAAQRMQAFGYTDVSVLEEGISGWEAAGFRLYAGVHVPSKAFAEFVEHDAHTPSITADELRRLIESRADMVLLDSRSFAEYCANSIPGAVNVPGAELVYRFPDLVRSRDTTVVVNCGGRTRSIIGAQSLIDAGFPNKIVALENGTMAWHLAGYQLVRGEKPPGPAISAEGRATAMGMATRVAGRTGISRIDRKTLDAWRRDSAARSLYVFDVRTQEEYEAGHLAGARPVPGGQLLQETDNFIGTWNARIVLTDTDGVRATMTAYWLRQMGWDAHVFIFDENGPDVQRGAHQARVMGLDGLPPTPMIEPYDLNALVKAGGAVVIDLENSKQYARGHVPGAWFAARSSLPEVLSRLPQTGPVVLTSSDGTLATLAFPRLSRIAPRKAMVLRGGTAAWRYAGLPLETGRTHMASEGNDVFLPPRDRPGNPEEEMRKYLEWELNLVSDMANDDDQRFRLVSRGEP